MPLGPVQRLVRRLGRRLTRSTSARGPTTAGRWVRRPDLFAAWPNRRTGP